MIFQSTRQMKRSKPLSKTLFASSAASVLSAFMVLGTASTAQAQVVNIQTCSEFVNNPGTDDAGVLVEVFLDQVANSACTVANGDVIELENGQQDDVTINIAADVTLISTDTSDEDVVVFIDNSENNTRINVAESARLSGVNGVIFQEGDGLTLFNNGTIVGTGAAEEGVVYIDRDTDGDENLIVNNGTIAAQDNGPAIGIEVLLADGSDDPEDVGVQDALVDFPTIRVINRADGIISAIGSASDDNDGISIAGSPGSTGGLDRTCFEANNTTNCNFNLSVVNAGTIRSVFDNSGVAGITIEDDAIFHGSIVNRANGLITGTVNGIRIGDAADDLGNTAEHDGVVNNSGRITGTGENSRGIDLEGDGVTISNTTTGVISGLSIGIAVGAGSSSGVNHSGVNNNIVNRGAITGGSFAIDSNEAEGALRVNNVAGSLNGDVRGSVGNTDLLGITGGVTDLTHDVLQDFNVNVAASGTLNFVGDRLIEGNLFSNGVVNFDLANTQTVTGNVILRTPSTVSISDASGVGAIGEEFTLISVGGTLTNNATLDATQAIVDGSFLLDFEFVDSNDLVVGAVAGGAGEPSSLVADIKFDNASALAFGETVISAFVVGDLNNTSTFSSLGGLGNAEDVGFALSGLAPDYSGNLVQNVFNTVQGSSAQLDQRLDDLDCNNYAQGSSETVEACNTFAQTGAWVQSSSQHDTQGSLSSTSSTFFNHGSEANSVTRTYGYDQAVSESTILGFSGTYTESEIDEGSTSASSTELDVLQLSAYAGRRVGNANFVTKASYAYGEAETRRQSFDVIKSQLDVKGINAQSIASYNVDLGQGYYLKPQAGLHYNNVTTSAFTEAGGLNLNVDEVNTNVLDGRVGLTLGARKLVSEDTRADAYVSGSVRNDFYGDRDDIGYNFAGQSGSLAVTNIDSFAVQALAGVNVHSGKTFTFGAAVNSEFSNSENAVGGSVKTQIRW